MTIDINKYYILILITAVTLLVLLPTPTRTGIVSANARNGFLDFACLSGRQGILILAFRSSKFMQIDGAGSRGELPFDLRLIGSEILRFMLYRRLLYPELRKVDLQERTDCRLCDRRQ